MFATVGLLRLICSEVLKDVNNRSHFLVIPVFFHLHIIIAYLKELHLCYPRNHKINMRCSFRLDFPPPLLSALRKRLIAEEWFEITACRQFYICHFLCYFFIHKSAEEISLTKLSCLPFKSYPRRHG